MSNTLEFPYKTFVFSNSRIGPSLEAITQFLRDKKQHILNTFGDIYNINPVLEYGFNKMNVFQPVIIKSSNNEKEKIILTYKGPLPPALELFAALINMNGLSEEEIRSFKEYYFFRDNDNSLVYYSKIQIVEGAAIYSTLLEEIKDKGSQIRNFNQITDFIQRGVIICRKCEDVLGRTHYDTILNPKMAINTDTANQIIGTLPEIENLLIAN